MAPTRHAPASRPWADAFSSGPPILFSSRRWQGGAARDRGAALALVHRGACVLPALRRAGTPGAGGAGQPPVDGGAARHGCADHGELARLCDGRRAEPRARGQPRLLPRADRLGRDRHGVPGRAPAPGAVGGGGDRRPGRAQPPPASGPPAAPGPLPRRELQQLRGHPQAAQACSHSPACSSSA